MSAEAPSFSPPLTLALPGGPQQVVAEALPALRGCEPALVLIFCPRGAEVRALSAGISDALGQDCLVLACSSAGGFAYGGYDDEKTVLIAFPARNFRAGAVWLENLTQTPVMEWMRALRPLEHLEGAEAFPNHFGVLLIDGASGHEELVTATCEAVIPSLMVVGGSAADGLRFGRTHLALQGEEREVAAVFCRIATDFAIEEIILDHFNPEGDKIVVTDADPENRILRELNAEPAALEYARLIGVLPEELSPAVFAAHPLIETQGGRHFVRAIRGREGDGGLSLMSAIETGAILGIGRAESLAERLAVRLNAMPPAEMVLGFDCVLRRLAVEQAGEQGQVADLYARHRVAGFSTYGEQHGGFHVNQTFVGLAFRTPARHASSDDEGDGDARAHH